MSDLVQSGRAGQRLTDYEVIDFHGHLGRWFFAIPDVTPGSIVVTMDRLGVAQMLVSSLECAGCHTEAGNDEVLEAMRAYPGRFLGYVVVWPSSSEAVRAEIERRLDQGFTGIKLHISNGFDYTCAAYGPAYEIADERRLPVLVHTYGEQCGLNQMPGLAGKHKGANFVLAHSGVGSIEEYIRLANDYPNVYLELCGSTCVLGVVERLVTDVPVEKILWGSDTFFINTAHQLGKVLGANIPEGTKRKLLSTNARRLLSLIRR